MNSWFLYEVMVFSMGSISAKVAYYLGKFDHTMSVMVLGSGQAHEYHGALVCIVAPIDNRAYLTMWCGLCFVFLLA